MIETHDQFAGGVRIVEMVDNRTERFVEPLMRIALGQQSQMPGERLQPVDGGSAVERPPRRVQVERLDLIGAEMLVETRAP